MTGAQSHEQLAAIEVALVEARAALLQAALVALADENAECGRSLLKNIVVRGRGDLLASPESVRYAPLDKSQRRTV